MESMASNVKTMEPIPEVAAIGVPPQSLEQFAEQAAPIAGPNNNFSSGEFVPAQKCNECIVPVPQQPPNYELKNSVLIDVPKPIKDYSKNEDMGCFEKYYEKGYAMINSRHALLIWLLLMSLLISAQYTGARYLFSCPGSLSNLMFYSSFSLMAVFFFRICAVIRRMVIPAQGALLFYDVISLVMNDILYALLLFSSMMSEYFFLRESGSLEQNRRQREKMSEKTESTHASTPVTGTLS